ncbi:MAG: asparagine synthase (glutamine-hydrolyzing) [Planctomycetes bacterium]|nr:asparagine synthase (glutamine-hydrolyzing) [Planctomycetota bacterium]
MCGLCGIYKFNKADPDEDLVVRMRDALAHRGPDDAGIYKSPGVCFGFRRLSIIDVAGGHQPLFNEDGTVAVMLNGEIYNYRELRDRLLKRGHRLATKSDTEVIAHLYEEYGPDFVHELRGMFAIAVHDSKRRRMVLARDRLGIKPMYIRRTNDAIYFGSELKSILADATLRKEIDATSVLDFLTIRSVPAPKSVLKGVEKLRQGTRLVADADGTVKIEEYWRPSFANPLTDSPGAIAEELSYRLDEAVKLRMIAEVPLGAFLSGGVDSSAVVASMARQSSLPIKTCSVGFEDREHDEREQAAFVANLFKTDHWSRLVPADPALVLDTLPEYFDEPFSDSSAVPTYIVSKLARERVTVALSGDGGDESFAGYRRYKYDALENRVRALVPAGVLEPAARAFSTIAPSGPRVPRWMRGKTLLTNLARDPARAYFYSVSATPVEVARAVLAPDLRKACAGYDPFDDWKQHYDDADTDDPLGKILYTDIRTYLADDILTKVDRASMAVSLEARVPVIDHKFIEWTSRIPSSLKLKNGGGKYIFKRALEARLPARILYGKKHGFSVPLSKWTRSDFAGPLDEVARTGAGGLLDGTVISQLLAEHRGREADHSEILYAALVLDRWRNRWMRS